MFVSGPGGIHTGVVFSAMEKFRGKQEIDDFYV
jgi:hypothetical protein